MFLLVGQTTAQGRSYVAIRGCQCTQRKMQKQWLILNFHYTYAPLMNQLHAPTKQMHPPLFTLASPLLQRMWNTVHLGYMATTAEYITCRLYIVNAGSVERNGRTTNYKPCPKTNRQVCSDGQTCRSRCCSDIHQWLLCATSWCSAQTPILTGPKHQDRTLLL
jgi:hypothetical protein